MSDFERGDGWNEDDERRYADAASTELPARTVDSPRVPVVMPSAVPVRRLPPGVRTLEATNIARRDSFDGRVTAAPHATGFEAGE